MKFELTLEQISLLLDSLNALSNDILYENAATDDAEVRNENEERLRALIDFQKYVTDTTIQQAKTEYVAYEAGEQPADIKDTLKGEMKSRGLTYDDVAKAAGKTRQAIWDKLNARFSPTFAGIAAIAVAMGIKFNVRRKDGKPLDFDPNYLLGIIELTEASYDDIQKILAGAGLEIVLSSHL